MANPFVHVELNTQDVGKAKDFYGKLFDWKLEDMAGGMDYTLIKVGEGTAGGIMKHPCRERRRSGWRMSRWTTSTLRPPKPSRWVRP